MMKKIKNWVKDFIYRYFEVVEIDEDGHKKTINHK